MEKSITDKMTESVILFFFIVKYSETAVKGTAVGGNEWWWRQQLNRAQKHALVRHVIKNDRLPV